MRVRLRAKEMSRGERLRGEFMATCLLRNVNLFLEGGEAALLRVGSVCGEGPSTERQNGSTESQRVVYGEESKGKTPSWSRIDLAWC